MLYTEEMVRANIRNREGKRVFFLGKGDTLTSGARDFLKRERIEIRPGEEAKIQRYRLPNGAELTEKPEQMTHLYGDVLVPKTHPRIAFRGAMDSLEAELIFCQLHCGSLEQELGEILNLARMIIRCEVMEELVPEGKLCGLRSEEQRRHSHRPQDFYGQAHFMPGYTDGEAVVLLNKCRCMARNAELAAARAFVDGDGRVKREDILKALNRMSSMIYILMIREKAARQRKQGEKTWRN